MGAPQGKRMRGLSRTCRCAWLDGRWTEEAGPRRSRAAAAVSRRGGAPVGMGLNGRACELHGYESNLTVWPIWAMWGRSDGATVSSSSPALMEGQTGNG